MSKIVIYKAELWDEI